MSLLKTHNLGLHVERTRTLHLNNLYRMYLRAFSTAIFCLASGKIGRAFQSSGIRTEVSEPKFSRRAYLVRNGNRKVIGHTSNTSTIP